MSLTADVGHLDLRKLRGRLRAQLRVPIRPATPDLRDRLLDLRIGGAAADERAQIVPAHGEEARVELPFGRQPRARAVAAERLGDGRDHADLAGAVDVAPPARDL